ncbi:hypothetical protein PAXINDRAFT_59462, partial [Paxillus involutus ATCC 200175]
VTRSFAYVGAALVSTVWLMGWQTFDVALYAEKAEVAASLEARIFNCARACIRPSAFQGLMDDGVLHRTLVSTMTYPHFAACAFRTFARVLYTIGHLSGDP